MKRLWWMIFGRAYLRGYKAGLLDGELSCLEKQIATSERDALRTLVALNAGGAETGPRARPTLH